VVARLTKNPKFVAVFGDEVEKRAMRMVSARPETMFAMLEMENERWGSAEGYVKKECGLTDEEIERVRRILIEESTH
jgi:protein tyrosine/serine phosphatase